MNKKLRYMNFPVSFLDGAFEDIKNTIENIIYYAIFKQSESYSFDTEEERVTHACKFFGVNLRNIQNASITVDELHSEKDLNTPNVSINKNILFDYLNNPKKEFDLACFLAFCSIKSILGNKDYIKTNKSLIIARMFGLADIENSDNETITNLFAKYSKRYHIDKVLLSLQLDWGLKLYSDHTRGFFISFTKPLEYLAMVNIRSKEKVKAKALVDKKAEAKRLALKKYGLTS